MTETPHRHIVIRGMLHIGLYWPTWWFYLWINENELSLIFHSIGKMIFYSNLYYMLIYMMMIAKGKSEIDRDVIKFSLFIIFILVIMEIPTWLYVFSIGQG